MPRSTALAGTERLPKVFGPHSPRRNLSLGYLSADDTHPPIDLLGSSDDEAQRHNSVREGHRHGHGALGGQGLRGCEDKRIAELGVRAHVRPATTTPASSRSGSSKRRTSGTSGVPYTTGRSSSLPVRATSRSSPLGGSPGCRCASAGRATNPRLANSAVRGLAGKRGMETVGEHRGGTPASKPLHPIRVRPLPIPSDSPLWPSGGISATGARARGHSRWRLGSLRIDPVRRCRIGCLDFPHGHQRRGVAAMRTWHAR